MLGVPASHIFGDTGPMIAPLSIVVLLAVANLSWSIQMLTNSAPWSGAAPALFVAGTSLVVVVAIAGLLLARAQWSVHLTTALGSTYAVSYVVFETSAPFAVVAMLLSALTIVGSYGPWLRSWMRKRPSMLGPGRIPTAMMLIALAAPMVTGLVHPSDLAWVHIALPAVSLAGLWAYAQAHVSGLWVLRVGVPLAASVSLLQSPVTIASTTVAYGVFVSGFAWRKEPLSMVRPIIGSPSRRRRRTTNVATKEIAP